LTGVCFKNKFLGPNLFRVSSSDLEIPSLKATLFLSNFQVDQQWIMKKWNLKIFSKKIIELLEKEFDQLQKLSEDEELELHDPIIWGLTAKVVSKAIPSAISLFSRRRSGKK